MVERLLHSIGICRCACLVNGESSDRELCAPDAPTARARALRGVKFSPRGKNLHWYRNHAWLIALPTRFWVRVLTRERDFRSNTENSRSKPARFECLCAFCVESVRPQAMLQRLLHTLQTVNQKNY